MKYSYFDGIKISQLTLGTVQLGMDYGISNESGKPSREKAYEILRKAAEGGVTSLDTSSDYGESETVIGDYVGTLSVNSPFSVITKFSVDATAEEEVAVEQCVRSSVEHSLECLGLNQLDLLLVHNEKDVIRCGKILPKVLNTLKKEGLIRHAGASVNTDAAIRQIAETDVYEAVQLPFNMLDTGKLKRGSIQSLVKSNKLLFIRSVFLQGLFFMDPEKLPGGVLQHAKEPLQKLRQLAEQEGMSVAELAVSFVRDTEGVTSLVLGVAAPEQIQENLKLMSAPILSERARAELIGLYDSVKPEVMMPWLWNQ